MATKLGTATVNIGANLSPLRRGLMNAQTLVAKSVSVMGSLFKSVLGGALNIVTSLFHKIVAAAKYASIALIGVGIASLKMAADAEETENLFVESMGSMSDAARDWVKETATALRMNETNIKKNVGTFYLMFQAMEVGDDKAYEMATSLTKLAYDMASFRNIKPEEAFEKLRAGITGETEPLKRLGILVSDAAVQQEALKDKTLMAAKAAAKSTNEWKFNKTQWERTNKTSEAATVQLTEQEKIMMRYRLILKQTTKDQGDLERTAGSTTNVFRALNEQIKTTSENFGKGYSEAVGTAVNALVEWLVENQETITRWGEIVGSVLGKIIEYVTKLVQVFESKGMKAGLTKMAEDIKAVFEVLKPYMVSYGEMIGTAIANGIRNAVSSVGGTEIGGKLKGIWGANVKTHQALNPAVGAYRAYKNPDEAMEGVGKYNPGTYVGMLTRVIVELTNQLKSDQRLYETGVR